MHENLAAIYSEIRLQLIATAQMQPTYQAYRNADCQAIAPFRNA